MNKSIFYIFILFFFAQTAFAGRDLTIDANVPVKITMQIASIPFEGINRSTVQYNRLYEIFNGTHHKRYLNQSGTSYLDSQIVYFQGYTNIQLASCYYEAVDQENAYVFGCAKYLITIQPINDTFKTMRFYFNTLDSKLGWDSLVPGFGYHDDFTITYHYGAVPFVVLSAAWSGLKDTISFNDPDKEFTTWKLLLNREQPLEKNFQARTTPFPIHPQLLEDNYNVFKELILGTTVIFDGVYNNVGGHDLYGYNTVTKFVDFTGDTIKYYTDPPIDGPNSPGNTFCTPAYGDWYTQGAMGMTIKAGAGDKMIIKNNRRLWVTGRRDPYTNDWTGDKLIFEAGSTLEKESTAQINTCRGGKLIDNGANTVWASGSFHKAYKNSSLEYYGSQHTVNRGGHIEINGNATLKLGDNTTLIFDSAGAYLKLNPGANVILGSNAQIKFTNGAYLDANGATFNNPNGYWLGILFENAGANTNIRNCTFSKAVTALSIYNTGTSGFGGTLYNNTFNVQNPNPNEHYKGIYARNIYNLSFSQNHFNLSSGAIGVLVQDFSNPVEPGGDGNPSMLIFTNNVFTGGYLQLFVGGYASNYIPVNINYNTFNSNLNGWCFAGRMITGDIKNNTMTRSSYNSTMGLWQSNPGLTSNNITNQNGNVMFLSAAYPVTAPTINNENYLVWYGGYNRFNATNGDNISLSVSKPILDNGLNCFTISSSSSYYHLYGNIPTAETIYPASNNGWQGNGSAPKKYLYNINSISVSVTYLPTISCGQQINYNSFTINDLGDGYYDTVWVSDNNLGIQAPEDEVLYSQAEESRGGCEYFDAITDLKNLIDNYDSSNYLCTSLYDLFTCYEGLDTSDQNHRDIIFGDLKFYLSNKIVQYEDKAEFVSIAYNLILMCEAKIENYNEAMTGYEFISLYHPDPEQRILASMDYGYIQDLLNGMGGGESSHERSRMIKKSTKAGHERSRMINLLKLMDKKPYTRIVKDIFIKGSKELEKKLNDEVSKTDKQMIQKKELIERAKQNVSVSRGLSREQREQRRMDDIRLLIKDESQDINNITKIPSNYSLHQNYPNPFNPVTTIKYELPKDEFISFKIYDILGREIYSINEFKKAGVYDIKFDGSNYASGIYFYRLESGSFVETKKMVLVK